MESGRTSYSKYLGTLLKDMRDPDAVKTLEELTSQMLKNQPGIVRGTFYGAQTLSKRCVKFNSIVVAEVSEKQRR